jgi:hypothetical protein
MTLKLLSVLECDVIRDPVRQDLGAVDVDFPEDGINFEEGAIRLAKP